MISTIIFDASGVLHMNGTLQREDLKTELGLTEQQLDKFYSHYLPLLGKGEINEKELWSELATDFGIRKVNNEERLLTRAFENSLTKMPGMYELVDELKLKDFKVMLLTNVSKNFAEVLERRGHYEPFSLRILSHEVGSWKPEAKIYKVALEKAGISPGEAIFIDDEKRNIDAAEALGIKGVLFISTEQLRTELYDLIN